MAYHDALFQLGMDLTRSSTAQKEDHVETARVARSQDNVQSLHAVWGSAEDRRYERRPGGDRIVIDLVGGSRFRETCRLETALKSAVELAGGRPIEVRFDRQVPGGGISGEVVLARGRMAFRTGFSAGVTTVDLIGCDGMRPERAMMALSETLGARESMIKRRLEGRTKGPSMAASMMQSDVVSGSTTAPRAVRVPSVKPMRTNRVRAA